MVAERFDERGATPDAGFAVKLVMVRVAADVGVNGEPVGMVPPEE